MGISTQLEKAVQEAQRVAPALAFPDEEKGTKPGAFKVSSKVLKLWKQEVGTDKPSEMLFKRVRDFIDAIPRQELPKYFGITGGGQKDIPDAQDFIAGKPRQAFQKWLRMSAKVNPKLAKYLRGVPDNASLVFYMFMERISGQDLAKLLFKRYFETESDHPGELARKK